MYAQWLNINKAIFDGFVAVKFCIFQAPTEVKLSTLLSFAKNSREVKIDANRCTVITKDLCSLRKV